MSKQPKIKYKYRFLCKHPEEGMSCKIVELDIVDDELAIATFEKLYNYYTWLRFDRLN